MKKAAGAYDAWTDDALGEWEKKGVPPKFYFGDTLFV
jgi:hypothetical protein